VTGIVDVVVDGETGLLFPVGDVPALIETLARLITDKTLASKLGRAGQDQVNVTSNKSRSGRRSTESISEFCE